MKYNVRINDTVYEVEVIKGEAQLLSEYKAINAVKTEAAKPAETKAEQPAPQKAAASTNAGDTPITAPLPGQVVGVKVAVGQKVNAGDVVAIIEAMKMENEITASVNGVVAAIPAPKGTQVVVGDPIIVLA